MSAIKPFPSGVSTGLGDPSRPISASTLTKSTQKHNFGAFPQPPLEEIFSGRQGVPIIDRETLRKVLIPFDVTDLSFGRFRGPNNEEVLKTPEILQMGIMGPLERINKKHGLERLEKKNERTTYPQTPK